MTEIIRIGGLELRFLRSKHDTNGGLDLFEMAVAPGAKMPVPHYHEGWEETVYGLDGTVTFTVAGRAREVGRGESLFIPRGTVHGFDNRGAGPARCLCILAPGVLGPAYFREMAALVAGGAPDPARLRETMLRHGLVPVEAEGAA